MKLVLRWLIFCCAFLFLFSGCARSKQLNPDPVDLVTVNQESVTRNLSKALTFKTISTQERSTEYASEFQKFHAFLETTFPKVHSTLKKEMIGDSLLFAWRGTDPSLAPVLLMSHQDVVPVDEKNWTVPPFEGLIKDGFVWGRGAIDDKSGVLGILEAAELLLNSGYQPKRTIYLSFGHDEEIGGVGGARETAKLLQARGIRLDFVIDEGMVVVDGILPGMDRPVALVGIAEKGYASIELKVKTEGGHSSQPPPRTAVGILGAAIAKLEKNPMPARIAGPVRDMFNYVGPEMNQPLKFAMTNLWLTSPLVKKQLSASPPTNATIRTTTAATIFNAGMKENVLPQEAKAVVNFRILPGDTIQDVLSHIEEVVDDERIQIATLPNAVDPSKISDVDSNAFAVIHKTIRQVFPETAVAPALVVGGTDSRSYEIVCDNVFRFQPLTLVSEDLIRIHGNDERVSIEGYRRAVEFYAQLIKNAGVEY